MILSKKIFMNELTWVEVSKSALENNIREIKKVLANGQIFCPCVKANAYGHGLVETAKIFLNAGADWLGVNSIYEGRALREAGICSGIYVLGYIPLDKLEEAVDLDLRFVAYNVESLKVLGQIFKAKAARPKIHIKIETGNNRQGVMIEDLVSFANLATENNIEIEGLTTHFANVEDTTDHSYAKKQFDKFIAAIKLLSDVGINPPIKHCSNSAAAMLFKNVQLDMVRPGIACYGMWPSNETFLSVLRETENKINLKPAFSWKSKIAQIKEIPSGEYIGYGCTYRTSHKTRLAIIPVGYYDGYDRAAGSGYVLINGKRAQIRGRICMNIIMVEVTDIPEAKLEDEVVLIGKSALDSISSEQFAGFAGTINYEITTRVNERIPRIFVD